MGSSRQGARPLDARDLQRPDDRPADEFEIPLASLLRLELADGDEQDRGMLEDCVRDTARDSERIFRRLLAMNDLLTITGDET